MCDIERAAIAAEGYDPDDDPAVVAALARVTVVLREIMAEWQTSSTTRMVSTSTG